MSPDDVFRILQRLSLAHGISGREATVASQVHELVAPLCDETHLDALGNLIACKRGEQPDAEPARIRLMIAAHTDEIGLVVSDIDDNGFILFSPVGGVDRSHLPAKEVWVHTPSGPLPGIVTTRPPHLTSAQEREQLPRWDEFRIDTGLLADTVRERVRIGDMITLRSRCERLQGQRAAGKAFDDRVGVTALIVMLHELQRLRHSVDVYLVATVQEEVGLRGAITASFGVAPHVGVAVDVGFAQQPGVEKWRSRDTGKGPILARGANIHPEVYAALEAAASDACVPLQKEVVAGHTGTDAWAMQVSREGVPTGLLSVPLASMHSPVETADLRDIAATGRLLAEFASRLQPETVRGWHHVLI